MWSALLGFTGGIVAWAVTTAISQPLRDLIKLRHQAVLALAEYEQRVWALRSRYAPR